MAEQKADKAAEPRKTENVGNGLDFGRDTETVFLADVDPADGSEATKKSLSKADTYDGTTAEELPPAPVEKATAAAVLSQREWEANQGKLAANPDPDKE